MSSPKGGGGGGGGGRRNWLGFRRRAGTSTADDESGFQGGAIMQSPTAEERWHLEHPGFYSDESPQQLQRRGGGSGVGGGGRQKPQKKKKNSDGDGPVAVDWSGF